jgi:hypothetical protein
VTFQLAPITDADLSTVADFLYTSLNHKVSAATWRQAPPVPWKIDAPNHGFLLRDGEQIATALVPNLPLPFFSWRVRTNADPQVIEGTVAGSELEPYRDHTGKAAAHHLVLTRGNGSCCTIFRKATRKSVSIRAAILYVSHVELFHQKIVPLARYLWIHYETVATLAELRIAGQWPRSSFMLSAPRQKMYKSTTLEATQIDDPYSEHVYAVVSHHRARLLRKV